MIYETYSVGGVLYHHGIKGQQWGHRNGPPYPLSKEVSTGNRLKIEEHSGQKKDIKKANSKYKPTSYSEIKRDDKYDMTSQDVKFKDYTTSVYTFNDYNTNVSDDQIKRVAKMYGDNAEEFTKSAFKAIKNDKDLYQLWGEPLGISEKEFFDKLAIRGVYTTDKSDNVVEINVYEKNDKDDILGGHSLDMEFDIRKPKKVPKWVAMNG